MLPLLLMPLRLSKRKVRSLTAANRWIEAIDYLKGLNLREVHERLKDVTNGAADYFPSTAKTELKV